MLSSTVGFAPTAIKIENASHEFDSIRGVLEDVAALIVNLKKIRFNIKNGQTKAQVDYSFSGPRSIKGSDFSNDSVEVVTPDMHFASINEDGELNISLIIEKGMGYVPSEDIREQTPADFLPLDAYFMPVLKANYKIEKVLVEDNPNFEKIVFNIETDGGANPIDVFDNAVMTMYKQLEVFKADFMPVAKIEESGSKEEDSTIKVMKTRIEELNLSARSHNCLSRSDIRFIGEIVLMDEEELAKLKNLGKKSLDEIKDKISELNITESTGLTADVREKFTNDLMNMKG
jgi:DNA-directed RNA polymerase subunit alpha